MTDDNGNLIIFNGEIYNYKELIKKHKLKNLKTSSDTEVLLALYKKIGDNFVKDLNGIFSFNLQSKIATNLHCKRQVWGKTAFLLS